VTAVFDVFTKHPEGSGPLFNVVTVAATSEVVTTEDGIRIVPDYSFASSPRLDVLVIPSAYDMSAHVSDTALIQYVRDQNEFSKYTMSNCAGAQIVGESGIASGRKIVTWIGGGVELQQEYPDLDVQDDATVAFVRDGKFFSSNGNLATYIAALALLEEMTTREHRRFVESYVYLERLRQWQP
jgi:transcriptional regulator GlxA family with amidase domain